MQNVEPLPDRFAVKAAMQKQVEGMPQARSGKGLGKEPGKQFKSCFHWKVDGIALLVSPQVAADVARLFFQLAAALG